MRNLRKHKRFKLNVIDLSSSMSLVGKVDIIDISAGGVAIRAERKINLGKEYLMTLGYGGKLINVKGQVMRSELCGVEERAEEEKVTIYCAGIVFNDESSGKVQEFLDTIEQGKKTQVAEQAGWFYRDIKFFITMPSEKVLNLQAQFDVKEISQLGVIIQTHQQLRVNSMLLMELSLNANDPVSFMGKVVSCRKTTDKPAGQYDVGVEFIDLTDMDKSLLMRFIEIVKEKGKRASEENPE